MAIGPFSSYAPPGVYTSTVQEPSVTPVTLAARIPVYIGTGMESITRSNFLITRGLSASSDTPVFNEDVAGRWVISGPNENPVLGASTGNQYSFRTRNWPILTGDGTNTISDSAASITVTVDGEPVVVGQVDGANGIVTLVSPPSATSLVLVSYYFDRSGTQITDDLSDQVTSGSGQIVAQETSYTFTDLNKVLTVYVNDSSSPSVVTFATGTALTAAQAAAAINGASISGLTATTVRDEAGLFHVALTAVNNVSVAAGGAQTIMSFAPSSSGRNKDFTVFNRPIVSATNSSQVTTSPSDVTVTVDGNIVSVVAVDGGTGRITLQQAPESGAVVKVTYSFNSWVDTFDYLPDSSVQVDTAVSGITPGQATYTRGADYLIVNDGAQARIYWGAAAVVSTGEITGSTAFGADQVSVALVDNRRYGKECTGSGRVWNLGDIPTSGNGLDTPIGTSVYDAVTNSRMVLPTDNPNLVIAYVGLDWQDAYARGPVVVTQVDGNLGTITLKDSVTAGYKVYATFWYNLLQSVDNTLTVVAPGNSGTGTYTVSASGVPVYNVVFGTNSSSPSPVFPTGTGIPDAFYTGGQPVQETVTVTFDSDINPASHASIISAGSGPFNIFAESQEFGDTIIDGNTLNVDLSSGFIGVLLGQPVADTTSFDSTDVIAILPNANTSAVEVPLSAATTLSSVASAINTALSSEISATVVSYGSKKILKMVSVSAVPSATNDEISKVQIVAPTTSGKTFPASKLGLDYITAEGSFNALNQPGRVYGSEGGPFTFTPGQVSLDMTVDAVGIQLDLPTEELTTVEVSELINDEYFAVMGDGADRSAYLSALNSLWNEIKTDYNAHIADLDFHTAAGTSTMSMATLPSDYANWVSFVNTAVTAYNTHLIESGVHQMDDTQNSISDVADDLASATRLLHTLKMRINDHLSQTGVHGYDDTANVVTVGYLSTPTITGAADNGSGAIEITTSVNHGLSNGDLVFISGVVGTTEANGAWTVFIGALNKFTLGGSTFTNAYVSGGVYSSSVTVYALLNDQKAKFNLHRVQTGVHLTDDTTNVVTGDTTTYTNALALANDIKAKINAHVVDTDFHNVADADGVITAPDATGVSPAGFESLVTLAQAIAHSTNDGAYNEHRTRQVDGIHVHGTNDTIHDIIATSTLIARVGVNDYAGQLVLTSLTNENTSEVAVSDASANTILGLEAGTTGQRQVETSRLANALNANGTFDNYAVAYSVAFGDSEYLQINSLSTGSGSSIAFDPAGQTDTTFVTGTGIGIDENTGDTGEVAVPGFQVTSSNIVNGSSGSGEIGRTYADAKTGLRFTLLPSTGGAYVDGDSFTLLSSTTFTASGSLPTLAVPGTQITVTNTAGMGVGSTAIVKTKTRGEREPSLGTPYYVSYQYNKTDYSTKIFTEMKSVQTQYGAPTPENPVSLAARLAFLNGATQVAIKQVPKQAGKATASTLSYINAIDDLKKPIAGRIKPSIIVPLGTDPIIFSYLKSHVEEMSAPLMESERTGVVGVAAGTTPVGVQQIARGLGSTLVSVVYPDTFVAPVQSTSGVLQNRLVDGTFAAAALAATTCNPGIDVAVPWTRRAVGGLTAVGRYLTPTDANAVAVAGVTVLEQVDTGVRVRHGLTTKVDNVINRTPSVQLIIQNVQQSLRAALDPYIGAKFTPGIPGQVSVAVTNAFQALISAQIVSSVTDITVLPDANDPTVLQIGAVYVPVFPLEYIVVSLTIRVRA